MSFNHTESLMCPVQMLHKTNEVLGSWWTVSCKICLSSFKFINEQKRSIYKFSESAFYYSHGFFCDFEYDILNRNTESLILLENKASRLILKLWP